ncbi:MAG: hypothetical protein ACSHWU_05515 [Marinicella sp.]
MIQSQPTQALDFTYISDDCQLLPIYDRDRSTTGREGFFSDALVAQTLAICEEYWRVYLEIGFTNFGVNRDGRRVYEVRFDSSLGIPGQANDGRMDLRGKDLRDANDSTRTSQDRLLSLIQFKNTIGHELFHAVQYAVEDPFQSLVSFSESTADVAAYLLRTPAERQLLGLSSYSEYLANTSETMWDRTTPGVTTPYNTLSAPTLWWLYFATQLGSRTETPGERLDSFRDMLREGWTRAGTLEAAYTTRRHHGNFLGNRERQFLFDSDNPQRRLALVSANRSNGGFGAMHSRRNNGERFGAGGWRVRPEDRVVAVGQLLGNGRDQFVIKSQGPMYLGVLGYSHSDGAPFSSVKLTYAVTPEQERWGGWKVRPDDHVHFTGRFSGAARDYFVITSHRDVDAAHLGLLGFDNDGNRQTLASIREDNAIGGGWVYRSTDFLVTSGDLIGNGREQIVLQDISRSVIGVVGLDERNNWVTYAMVQENQRFGTGWRVKPMDRIMGIGKLSSTHRSQLILESREWNLGLVGFDASGNTETGAVVNARTNLGVDGWLWRRGDIIEGVGNFSASGLQHMVIRRDNQIGLIGSGRDNTFNTYDSTLVTDIKGLEEVWGIGDFAGLGNDQILGRTGARPTNYIASLIVEESYSPKFRTGRFVLNAENGVFTNTHYFLGQYIRERGDLRTFTEMWRDFTVTNIVKDLANRPDELGYSVGLPVDSPVKDTYPLRQQQITIKRWAAHYFEFPAPSQSTSIRLRGQVTSAPFRIHWTVVVADSMDNFRDVINIHSNGINSRVVVEPGDTVFLIITTTYASVDIELGGPI